MANEQTEQNEVTRSRFVHLHLHSQYSLLDGGNRVDRLVQRVKELGMDAVAVTDHGNLFGAVDFYTQAKNAGLKPILGIEAYVAPDIDGKPSDRTDRQYTGVSDGGFHLVLLAENNIGWANLLKLSSDAFTEGFYFKPRMDKTTLPRHAEGLIAINGHLGSSIAFHLQRYEQTGDVKHYNAAKEEARWHAGVFKPAEDGEPRFYLELQRHETPEQDAINPHVQRLAEELDLPLVCDNDAHFLGSDDYDAHDTLCCISMGKTKQDASRLQYPKQLYVKSAEQMSEQFSDVPEAIDNTRKIADRCHVDIDFEANHAPVVNIDVNDQGVTLEAGFDGAALGSTAWFKAYCAQFQLRPFDATKEDASEQDLAEQCDQALRRLCEAGLLWRYGPNGVTQAHRDRLERELTILSDKMIAAYFLIVWDFVDEARQRDIPSNARGSGVGTMVGYVLGLSNACPVRFGLLFERFTDPERSEYPDIDIDLCQDGRAEIIDYVREKYGYVAQIITFNVLKAKAAVRDVGRVLDVPLSEVDKVCKLIGDGLGTTIEGALQQEPDLKQIYDENPAHREMLDTAHRLEGMTRHAGVHAAGVVIATQPLDNIIPLYQPANTNQLVTQWDGPTTEKVGLLKMDFLGLRTLSILEKAKNLIRQTLDESTIQRTVDPQTAHQPSAISHQPFADPLDLERLEGTDQNVLDTFRRGETAGVFQFESGGMRNLLMAMKPDRLEDLIAANALYRPGPMELIPNYNNRKNGVEAVPRVHEIVDRHTDETYGIMVYQEQVMQIVHELGGIPLRQAYTLIKAISKKKEKTINKERPRFIEGAKQNGLTEQGAVDLFDLILKFAGYGFNKSHSSAYAIVAYQTAYLKTYFPAHHMAAVLTYEAENSDKVVEYIDECRNVMRPGGSRGIEVKPPDINRSNVGFTVVYEDDEPHDADHGHIRFGLSAVKGVGEKAIRGMIEERESSGPFKSLYDFCERVPLSLITRSTLEALIKCGAFDESHGESKRAAMLEAVDGAIQSGQRMQRDRDSGQMNFFAMADAADDGAAGDTTAEAVKLPGVAPWSTNEQLQQEKAVLGLYVSSHPLDQHRETLHRFTTTTVEEAKQLPAERKVVLGGMLTRVKPTLVKKGKSAGAKMAMLTLDDGRTAMEGVAFADVYATHAAHLEQDRVVLLKGRVDRRREEPNLIIDEIVPIENAAQLTERVRIVIEEPAAVDRGGEGKQQMKKLEQVLQSAARRANGKAAEVNLELHQNGTVADLRLNNWRVAADEELIDSVEALFGALDDRTGRCERIGPPKLKPAAETANGNAAGHGHAPTHGRREPAPLGFSARLGEGEVCESVDRF